MTTSHGDLALGLILLLLSCGVLAVYVLALVRCWRRRDDPARTKWLWLIFLFPVAGGFYLFRRTRASIGAVGSGQPFSSIGAPGADGFASLPLGTDEQRRMQAIQASIDALSKSRSRAPAHTISLAPLVRQEIEPSLPPLLISSQVESTVGSPDHELPRLILPSPVNRPIGAVLGGMLLVCGVGLLCTSIVTSGYNPLKDTVPYRIGCVAGNMAIWPLIIIGLFSIGRRFRSQRTRTIILLVVWAVSLLGQLSTIGQHGRTRSVATPSSAPASPFVAPAAATVPAPVGQAEVRPSSVNSTQTSDVVFDFSVGSDERLSKTINSAREDRYRAVVAAYARACLARPMDAVLALERVRFIERFAAAEDFVIEGADEDLKTALAWLNQKFPTAPITLLHDLEQTYGPPFDTKVKRYSAEAQRWPKEQSAQFLLLQAQRSDVPSEQMNLARRSFELLPTISAGLLMLSNLEPSAGPEGIRLLDNDVFKTASVWEKKRITDFLFKVGANDRALALYEELRAVQPTMVQSDDMAQKLARAGRVAEAREMLEKLPVSEWNRASRLTGRFEFELRNGNADQAAAAYRAMRSDNLRADLFLTYRFALFRQYPMSGWSVFDLVGLITVAVFVGVILLLPAAVLLPVHYWSMLRARSAKLSGGQDARWGLRHIWLICGALLLCQVIATWIFTPAVVRSWGASNHAGEAVPFTDAGLIAAQCLEWAAMIALLGVVLARAKAWSLVGAGNWKWGRVLGAAVGCALGLRLLLGWYLLLFPSAMEDPVAAIQSLTNQLMLALLKSGGPIALLGTTAFLVPVVEEVLFRGVLLEGLAKHVPFSWANVIQALCFAFAHEDFGLFPFFVLFGLTCGWLARRSGGLLTSILVHVVNNAIVCTVLILRQ